MRAEVEDVWGRLAGAGGEMRRRGDAERAPHSETPCLSISGARRRAFGFAGTTQSQVSIHEERATDLLGACDGLVLLVGGQEHRVCVQIRSPLLLPCARRRMQVRVCVQKERKRREKKKKNKEKEERERERRISQMRGLCRTCS
eukprot:2550294-Rhodomonas_salina.3